MTYDERDNVDDDWFDIWLHALEKDRLVIVGDGAGQVLATYGDTMLVGATSERAIAYA